jgi:peptide/nickel transport system ATP-binding protein
VDGAAAEIVFDRVTKRYPGRTTAAVHDLSLTVAAGELCVLVGPSGGGKTTALKMVNRLIPFEEGEIRIDGRSVADIPVTELRRGIGYVIQQTGLFPHMTIADNVATVPRLLGWRRPRIAARVVELLELVGLDPADGRRYPAALSGGQRQRVGIARALVMQPEIVVCDEPTSALDVSVQAQILNLLLDLRQEFNLTYVFISHNLAVVEHIATDVAVMYLGRVVEFADTRTLFRTPQHPYTQALLASVLTPDTSLGIPETGLGLAFPDPLHPPAGCPFHPRCPQRVAGCDSRAPALLNAGPTRVACHLHSTISQGPSQ